MSVLPHMDWAAKKATEAWGTSTLKIMVIGVAIVFILIALFIDNPYVLAFLLAYEVLP